jgi:GR25 family glycosyltransferase involved in LPS biosynthesis
MKGAEKEFQKIGVPFTRFPAIDGNELKLNWKKNNIPGWNNNAAALLETTLLILKEAKNKKYESIVICEDDVFFAKNFKTKLNDMVIPDGQWDMLHFGTIHEHKPIKFNDSLLQLKRSFCCHAYVIHSRIFDDYIALLELRDRPIDWVTADFFQIYGRCFSTIPNLAFQKPDYSNIRNINVHNKIE